MFLFNLIKELPQVHECKWIKRISSILNNSYQHTQTYRHTKLGNINHNEAIALSLLT